VQAEIEARFLGYTYNELRKGLQAAGATCEYPMRAMKRVIMDYPDQRLQSGLAGHWGFVRVRDEGGQIRLTYKQIAKSESRDTHEIEVLVSSYQGTIALFEAIGLQAISEQHTRREVWHLQGCEVSLDDWPWLPSMVEVEGPSEKQVREVVRRLGLPWDERIVGNVVDAYRLVYPGMTEEDGIRDIPKLTFDEMPTWLIERQKSV